MNNENDTKENRTVSPRVMQSIMALLDAVDSILDESFAREVDGEDMDILNVHQLNELGYHLEIVRDWENEDFLKSIQDDDNDAEVSR